MAEFRAGLLPEKGLVKHSFVSAVISATQFDAAGLIGQGNSDFIGWNVYVLRKGTGTGAAPQGEQQIATAFINATGRVTCPAFTAPLAVGDEIMMIHPNIGSGLLSQINKLAGQTPVTGTTTANWNAAAQDIVTIGAAGVRYKVHSAIIGIQNLIGNITIRMYISINGVQRQIFPVPLLTTFNVATDPPGVPVINSTFGIANTLRITAQSDNAADNGQAVTYEYFLEAM